MANYAQFEMTIKGDKPSIRNFLLHFQMNETKNHSNVLVPRLTLYSVEENWASTMDWTKPIESAELTVGGEAKWSFKDSALDNFANTTLVDGKDNRDVVDKLAENIISRTKTFKLMRAINYDLFKKMKILVMDKLKDGTNRLEFEKTPDEELNKVIEKFVEDAKKMVSTYDKNADAFYETPGVYHYIKKADTLSLKEMIASYYDDPKRNIFYVDIRVLANHYNLTLDVHCLGSEDQEEENFTIKDGKIIER
jgi:hypothetical protein